MYEEKMDMDTGRELTEETRESAIERETIELRREAERCLKNVERLRKRLTPVIASRPLAGEQNLKETEPSTPLGIAVRGSRDLIRNSNATLDELFHSLEV